MTPARYGAIVPHPAWRQTLATLVEAASGGPTTLALLGEAGTGKSWLLRHLDTILRRYGRGVTFIRQGDLPWQLEPGSILLIDEASRLSARALAALAAQRTTVTILADLPSFGHALAQLPDPIPIVRLRPLGPHQVGEFVSKWLQLSDCAPSLLTEDAIETLQLHSGGTPRLITRLLNAAIAFDSNTAPITGAAIDEVALLRWSSGEPAPSEPKPEPARMISAPVAPPPTIVSPAITTPAIMSPATRAPRARRVIATVAAVSALAAAALLTLRVNDTPGHAAILAQPFSMPAPPQPIEAASIPAPAPAPGAPITVAEIAPAQPPLPALAPPMPARPTAPSLSPPPIPKTLAPVATPLASRPETPLAEPAATPPTLPKADLEAASVKLRPAEDSFRETPGLVVIARRGDTLRELYASLYRGVEPPPFEDVAAANPKPVVPGAVVVFPAPVGGWPH